MTHDISKYDNVIDSRDVIERIEELETILADGRQAALDAFDNEPRGEMTADEFANEYVDINLSDERDELKVLLALQEEAEGYAPDWKHGATLVRDSYWTDYVQELLEDIGDLPKGLPSYIEIDWERTARNIQMDYASVEFDGITYWVR